MRTYSKNIPPSVSTFEMSSPKNDPSIKPIPLSTLRIAPPTLQVPEQEQFILLKEDNAQVAYHVKLRLRLERFLDFYCTEKGLRRGEVEFVLRGSELKSDATGDDLKSMLGESIHVMRKSGKDAVHQNKTKSPADLKSS